MRLFSLSCFSNDVMMVDCGDLGVILITPKYKIEGPSYLKNKVKHNEYLLKHPYVAKKQSINLM